MRGVDLSVFDFDYDLTWMAFFLDADERVYGRFGSRDASSPDKFLTLAGLKHAMRAALATHAQEPMRQTPTAKTASRTAEAYNASRRLKPNQCIHCHQVRDFYRADLRAAGRWKQEDIWDYLPPQPESAGFVLDPERSNFLLQVVSQSAADRAGLKAGDELTRVNKMPVASFADVQYALSRAPHDGKVPVAWRHGAKELEGTLALPEGWRKQDISWRSFMWGLEPPAAVHGKDLTAEEKKELGLSPDALAFRQGTFVPPASREAGIKPNDIILGIDGKRLDMTMLGFNAHVRLNYRVGDKVTFNILRDGKPLDVPMKLPRAGN
jgi:membrane-associated protease RseP (regulator of RpoE activity)